MQIASEGIWLIELRMEANDSDSNWYVVGKSFTVGAFHCAINKSLWSKKSSIFWALAVEAGVIWASFYLPFSPFQPSSYLTAPGLTLEPILQKTAWNYLIVAIYISQRPQRYDSPGCLSLGTPHLLHGGVLQLTLMPQNLRVPTKSEWRSRRFSTPVRSKST